ncbi:MAG: Gfo/Idh/MocA family oxidoreductase [Kiritimatiellae bacterium]|nr:Gfo/Idh/MocA family oxidoreductase [Kiritimatiellia bacterium]
MNINRRGFLKGVSYTAAPLLLPGCTALTFSSNEKIRVAVIGLGRIASSFEIPGVLARTDIARIVAVCDLDSRRLDFAKGNIEKFYREKGFAGYTVDTYSDYKEVCARKDVDAVMLCLPDFWHALVSTTAICSGKAVWLQKPFTQTIEEGRLLANLAKRYNTVMQVGSQQRSWNQFQGVCEAVQNGVLGKIKSVQVGIGLDKAGGSSAAEPVPSTFDYATWLGPTDPTVPYNWTRCHSQDLKKISSRPGWIQLAPYGWGMITNWGAHHLDIARWGLGAVGPEGVSGTCSWMDLSGGKLWNVHTHYDLHYSFNGGKTDVHVCDKYQNGVKFIGENGDWLFCTRGAVKVTASDPDVPVKPGRLGPMAASNPSLLPKLKPMTGTAMQCHVDNWLEAIKANDPSKTVTNALGGHLSTAMCSLGQMCMKLGRGMSSYSLKWDAVKETTGNAKADALMKPFARDKFDLKVNLKEFGLDFNEVMKG